MYTISIFLSRDGQKIFGRKTRDRFFVTYFLYRVRSDRIGFSNDNNGLSNSKTVSSSRRVPSFSYARRFYF